MKHSLHSRQGGFSLLGMLIIAAFLAALGVLGAQALPTVLEYQAALKAVQKASELNTIPEVRGSFDRAAQIDDIKSIAGKDLEVQKEGDRFVVKFAYNREIHMFGPAYLLLKYVGRSK